MTFARHRAFGVLAALMGAVAMAAAPAAGQGTDTGTTTLAPTVTETQSFTVTIPAARPVVRPPAPTVAASSGPVTAAPLPHHLAYTGAQPLLLIAGGFMIAVLSLRDRRRTRA